jgi:single-stranded-DNA-specific exonuclease
MQQNNEQKNKQEKMTWQPKPFDKDVESSLLSNGVPRLIARLCAQRNIDWEIYDKVFSETNASKFELTNHKLLVNIDDISRFIVDFVESATADTSVAVIGDYDVDGITSAYMLKKFFSFVDIPCYEFIPSRFEHGYGLTSKIVDSVIAEFKDAMSHASRGKMPDVLFVVDSGSSSEKQIALLKETGVKHIVVIDHHLIEEDNFSKSADYVLNWRMKKESCETAQEMCSAGLVYELFRNIEQKFINGSVKSLKEFNSLEFLPVAAIATIADVSPIWGDNRVIVKHGLVSLKESKSAGLKKLIEAKKLNLDKITQEDVGFKLAPVINAPGRMGSPQVAFDLFFGRRGVSDEDLVNFVISKNTDRQNREKEITEHAKKMVKDSGMEHGILLVDDIWNIGVVGIVASRLVDLHKKPVVIVGQEDGVLKGSGRSIKGVNLKAILDNCKEMFDGYGGHEMAAGVSLNRAFVKKASALFNDACKKYFSDNAMSLNQINYFDARVNPTTVGSGLWDTLQVLYPFCEQNNPDPVFLLKDVTVDKYESKQGDNWTLSKFFVNDVSKKPFVSFSKEVDGRFEGKNVNMYFKLSQNKHPKYGVELNLVDIELVDVLDEE